MRARSCSRKYIQALFSALSAGSAAFSGYWQARAISPRHVLARKGRAALAARRPLLAHRHRQRFASSRSFGTHLAMKSFSEQPFGRSAAAQTRAAERRERMLACSRSRGGFGGCAASDDAKEEVSGISSGGRAPWLQSCAPCAVETRIPRRDDDQNGDRKGSTGGMALVLNKLVISRTPKNDKWDWRLRRADNRILAA